MRSRGAAFPGGARITGAKPLARLVRAAARIAAAVTLSLAANAAAAAPDLTVALRQTSADPAFTNTSARYETTLRNSGTSAATNGNVRVDLPSGFTFQSASGSGFTCTATTGATTNKVNCQSGQLAAGATRSFTVAATTPRTISGSRQLFALTATADPANLVSEGTAEANNTATLSTAVETAADLRSTWSGSPTSAIAGQDATFRATLQNTGDRAAAGSALRITLPLGQLSFLRFENNGFGGGCDPPNAQGQFSCRTASIAAGGSISVGIVTHLNPLLLVGDRLLFQASAALSSTTLVKVTVERSTANNSASLVTTIGSAPLDLVVTVVSSRTISPCSAGTRCVAVEYRVENRGPGTYTGGTQLRINKPEFCAPGSYFDGKACLTGPDPLGCQSTLSDRTCPIGNLAPGGSVRLTIFAFPASEADKSIQLTATVDPAGAITETNEQNNSVSITHFF